MPSTPPRRPAEWVRVKDKSTGHKFSLAAQSVDEERHQALKQDAVDSQGNPLPAEFATSDSTSTSADSGAKTEGRGAAKNEGEGK